MQPFGCHALYRASTNKLAVIGSRVHSGLLLRHKGGGVYRILTNAGTVRTKHVRFNDTEFPGMSLLGYGSHSYSRTDDETEDDEVSLGYSRERQAENGHCDAVFEEGDDDDNVLNDALTYIPPAGSTFGVTPLALKSDHSNDDPTEYDHKDEANVLSVIDSSSPSYLTNAQGSDQSSSKAPRYRFKTSERRTIQGC